MRVRTRFAPSPTGDLHCGGAWTALASWVTARRVGGSVVLRIEDTDTPRVIAGSEQRIEQDLAWLGLDWDEGPHLQSERTAAYQTAISALTAQGLVYPCDCSRAEIGRVASAPHPGEEVLYPGVCRDRDPARAMKRPPCLRVKVPNETLTFEDEIRGPYSQNLAREVGDFVVRRNDGVFAYQLAASVDDVSMGITHVVRGADLLGSTPRQIWIARCLGSAPPRYAHVPMVVLPGGARLEKRAHGPSVRDLRRAGMSPEQVLGLLAHGLGLMPSANPLTARAIARANAGSAPISWRTDRWELPNFAAAPVA